jgi:hypothetical protein
LASSSSHFTVAEFAFIVEGALAGVSELAWSHCRGAVGLTSIGCAVSIETFSVISTEAGISITADSLGIAGRLASVGCTVAVG